jgi:hypothetical protein
LVKWVAFIILDLATFFFLFFQKKIKCHRFHCGSLFSKYYYLSCLILISEISFCLVSLIKHCLDYGKNYIFCGAVMPGGMLLYGCLCKEQ